MTMRVIDPVVPAVARDFAISAETAALLATAFTFPYALGQPLLGSLGDALGKALIIKISLAVVLACLIAGAMRQASKYCSRRGWLAGRRRAASFPWPSRWSATDSPSRTGRSRCPAFSRPIITGQLMGSIGSGLLASYAGWRTSMLAGAGLALTALILTIWQLKPRPLAVASALHACRHARRLRAGVRQSVIARLLHGGVHRRHCHVRAVPVSSPYCSRQRGAAV